MSMLEVLDSVQRTVKRWAATESPLIENALTGSDIIKVKTTNRFRPNDELIIKTPSNEGTAFYYIKDVIDCQTLQLTEEIGSDGPWTVNEGASVIKAYNGNFVHGVYLGEPDTIPMYPAITVKAVGRSSDWLTLRATQERYNLQIAVYTLDAAHEDAYRFNLKLTDMIQKGLKANLIPLLEPYSITTIKVDANAGDQFIKVEDTSGITLSPHRAYIEDPWDFEEFTIEEVIDSETVKIGKPLCNNFRVQDAPKIILPERYVHNSWPSDISYGTVYKNTVLKASTIDWFAEEMEMQWPNGEPFLS